MFQENERANSSLNNIFIYEETEGGLNLKEIKNILSRKIIFIVGCTVAITSVVAIKIIRTPPVYESSFEILSESFNLETKITSGNFSSQSVKTREAITEIDLDEIQLKILESPKLINQIVQSLQDKYSDLNYQDLTRRISIDTIDIESKQNIIAVNYRHPDQQRVADVTEALAKIYVEYSLKKRQARVKKGIDFLDLQIPKLEREVKKIETQIKELRSKHNFIKADTYLQQLTNRLDNLEREKKQIETELQEANLLLDNLRQELQTQRHSSTTAIDLATPRYLALLNKLQQIDLEIGHTSVIFSNRSVEINRLQQERQKIIALITRERQSIYQKLSNRLKILKNRQQSTATEITAMQSQLQEWSAISPNYDRLEEELKSAKSKLNEFTRQKDALAIDIAQQEAPWQLLSPVTEPAINSTNAINYLILGSTLGLLVGVGTSLVWDSWKNVLYTSEQTEEFSKIPIIGEIPYSSKQEKITLKAQELNDQNIQLNFSDKIAFLPLTAFCSMATNLDLLEINSDLGSGINSEIVNKSSGKSIVITSATAGEGKSTVAFNLARAYASFLDRKVLLVDMDLRHSNNLTKNLNLESQPGLTNMLNHDASSSRAWEQIRQSFLDENLFVLPSGCKSFQNTITLDSIRLLASREMSDLMDKFKSEFDLIIYDLCHVNGLADVNLLAAKTDGIVMVAGMGKIQAKELTEAQKQLKLSKVNVLGLAANEVVRVS